MKKRISNIIISLSFIAFMLFFSVANIIAPDNEISYSERRKLTSLPEFSAEALFNKSNSGKSYFENLENYLLDQFVARDSFRALGVATRKYGLMQKDVGGIYIIGNDIFKMEYRLDENAVNRSADIYLDIIKRYFTENGSNIYYTIVPDKNFYSAEANGYLSLDYDKMFAIMNHKLSDYTFIDIRDKLSASDYYKTDLHWDQTKILDVANTILSAMGEAGNLSQDSFTQNVYEGFAGAYYGQAALPIAKDKLIYLSNDIIADCRVFDYESNKYADVYDTSKLGGIDSYDVFLGGARSLLRIENPENTSGKKLIVFRDSFGSSLAPLLVSAYSEILLVDVRYLSSKNLGRFVDIADGSDVLFMYNTGTLNTTGQGTIS